MLIVAYLIVQCCVCSYTSTTGWLAIMSGCANKNSIINKIKRKEKKKKKMTKNMKKHVSLYFTDVMSKYIYFW